MSTGNACCTAAAVAMPAVTGALTGRACWILADIVADAVRPAATERFATTLALVGSRGGDCGGGQHALRSHAA